MSRARLVLVDDHQHSLEGFSTLLREKYTVFGYASAVEALRAIHAANPDVLVLDIGMCPIDGVQCLEMIRATPGYRDIPAVALTAYARDVERERFLAAGFQAVVVKPVLDLGKLMAVIDRLVKSPAPSAAAAHLDARAEMTEPGADEPGAPGGQGAA